MLRKKQRKAIEETKAVFPSLRARIADAVGRVESELVCINTYCAHSLLDMVGGRVVERMC